MLFVLQSASGMQDVEVLKGARRDGGQTRFVEKSLVIAGEINDSIRRCTRLSVAGERCKSRLNYQNITAGF